MEITVSAAGDELALKQFFHWVCEDADFTRAATVSRAGTSGTGHMGALETICMTLSTTTGLASLGFTYASWRRTRKDQPVLKFTATGTLTAEQRKLLDDLNQPEDGNGAG